MLFAIPEIREELRFEDGFFADTVEELVEKIDQCGICITCHVVVCPATKCVEEINKFESVDYVEKRLGLKPWDEED